MSNDNKILDINPLPCEWCGKDCANSGRTMTYDSDSGNYICPDCAKKRDESPADYEAGIPLDNVSDINSGTKSNVIHVDFFLKRKRS